MERLWIGLSEWILADGNYRDFRVGQEARFALEFHAGSLSQAACPVAQLRHLRRESYQFCAPVVYDLDRIIQAAGEAKGKKRKRTENVRVLDLGVLTYCRDHGHDPLPPEMRTGTWWSGELSLCIDPFFYFEDLHRCPGIPPLIYPWRIERIIADRTPYIQTEYCMVPDETRETLVDVGATDQSDKEAHNYLLECTRTGEASKERLLPLSAVEQEVVQALIGVDIEVCLTGPTEYLNELDPGPYFATLLKVSDDQTKEQGSFLRLRTPLSYQGDRYTLLVGWPRFEGDGLRQLAAGEDLACSVLLLSPEFEATENPFTFRGERSAAFRASLRRV